MLTRSERDILQDQLALALAKGDPKNVISSYFTTDASTILRDLPANLERYDQYAFHVIDICIRSRWSNTPSFMEKLLAKLLTDGLSNGTTELMRALARLKLGEDPNDKHYESHWVLRDQPFFNRRKLRPLLKEFIQKDHRSLLRINGPGAGRTYTVELIDYLASIYPEIHLVPVVVAAKNAASYKVEDLAEELLVVFKAGVPDRTSSSYPTSLSRLILRKALDQPGLWIFVLDGFGQADLHPEVQTLVKLLAERSSATEYRRKIRVILVNYSDPLEDLLPAAIVCEEIPLPSVERQDLIDCLAQLNEQLAGESRKQIDVAELAAVADGLLARAPTTSDKARLRFLYDQLLALARQLRA